METSTSIQIFFLLFLVVAAAWVLYYFYFKPHQEKSSTTTAAYIQGLKYLAEQDNRRAIEKFKAAVRENSDNIDAYMKLADILREEGLAGNALRIHRDLVMRSDISDDEKSKIEFSLALDYWHKQSNENALKYFKKLLENKEYRTKTLPYLINIYEKDENFGDAAELIEKSSTAIKEKYKTKLVLLKVLQASKIAKQGEGKKARILFKEALKLKPDCVLSVLYIGQSYISEERVDDALQVWTDFCKNYPSKAYILFPVLEKTYFEQGNFAQIQKLYSDILKTDPENLPIYIALAKIMRKKGDFDTALSLINDARSHNLDQKALNQEEAHILFEQNKYKEAAGLAISIMDDLGGITRPEFKCKKCDYSAAEPFIQCAKCGNIDEPI